jgi:signal transduction histidine kinase
LVNTTNRLRQLAVKLRVRGDIKIREPQVSMHLYRIAQEALSNAAKHAGAKEVQVDVAREGTLLTMTITDDGKGLPLNGHTPKGLGLQTMNYRARSMGAALDIRNATGGGTMVRCAVQTAT